MKKENAEDPIVEALDRLPVLGPDRERAEQVRMRCHAALARAHTPVRRGGAWPLLRWAHPLEAAIAAGVSAAFLADVVRRALGLYGF
jgi:hypothetical protein